MGQELPGKEFMTPHVLHELFCYCQIKSVSFIVSPIDLELMSHGPLLVFHTPESSHDPVLAAEAGPRPPGPAILFHTEYTDLILAGKKKSTHTHQAHTHKQTHTHTQGFFAHIAHITFPEILREVKTGSQEGGRKKWRLLYSSLSYTPDSESSGGSLCMAPEAPPTCKYFGLAGILCTFPTGGETFCKHQNFC